MFYVHSWSCSAEVGTSASRTARPRQRTFPSTGAGEAPAGKLLRAGRQSNKGPGQPHPLPGAHAAGPGAALHFLPAAQQVAGLQNHAALCVMVSGSTILLRSKLLDCRTMQLFVSWWVGALFYYATSCWTAEPCSSLCCGEWEHCERCFSPTSNVCVGSGLACTVVAGFDWNVAEPLTSSCFLLQTWLDTRRRLKCKRGKIVHQFWVPQWERGRVCGYVGVCALCVTVMHGFLYSLVPPLWNHLTVTTVYFFPVAAFCRDWFWILTLTQQMSCCTLSGELWGRQRDTLWICKMCNGECAFQVCFKVNIAGRINVPRNVCGFCSFWTVSELFAMELGALV